MNDRVPLRDVATREFLGVVEADAVGETAALLASEGSDVAVVLRGGDPVGAVTVDDVLAIVTGGRADDTPVAEVMRAAPPVLRPDATLDEAKQALADGDVPCVLVGDGGDLLGTVTPRSVITADVSYGSAADQGERTTVRVEGTEGYADQSVCEVCGSLSGRLASVNGRLLCTDCRDVAPSGKT